MTEPSATTSELIRLLTERDAKGRAKYGTTLDRTDLTHAEWLQHMAEELLDAAGYALAARREFLCRVVSERDPHSEIRMLRSSCDALLAENAVLRDAREVLKRKCSALKAENLKLRNALAGYGKNPDECSDPDGGGACVADMAHHELTKQLEASGWRWDDDADSWVGPDDALRAENERLRAALLPLANLDLRGSGFDQRPDDQIVYARDTTKITVGDVRRARAALKGDSHD